MKNSQLIAISLVSISLLLNSCSIIGGIFKTGMGVGIFLVVVVLIAILAIVFRAKN